MRTITDQLQERLYCQCYEALEKALASVQTLNGVSGDIAPNEIDSFKQAQQTFIDEMMKQVIANLPKVLTGKISIMNVTDEDYAQALDTYDGSKNVARYYRYEDEENPLYFCQTTEGKFFLILHNLDWLTYDLEKIIAECHAHNTVDVETFNK